MFHVRLEAYDVSTGDVRADLGAPVVDKLNEIEVRGGEIRIGHNQDCRENVAKFVEMEKGGDAGASATASETSPGVISAADAPMAVDFRVIKAVMRLTSFEN